MKALYYFLILGILFLIAPSEMYSQNSYQEKFKIELEHLKDYFQIPGLAVLVEQDGKISYQDYLGYADVDANLPVDATTLFPIASITKAFSGVLILKLVERGKLDLDTSIKSYFPKAEISDSIQIKHVLSHTSQGVVGKQFYYSSRFSFLTQIIEQASGQSFEAFLNQEIIQPLGLRNTFLLTDEGQIKAKRVQLAQPYLLEDGLQKGHIEYGYSAYLTNN